MSKIGKFTVKSDNAKTAIIAEFYANGNVGYKLINNIDFEPRYLGTISGETVSMTNSSGYMTPGEAMQDAEAFKQHAIFVFNKYKDEEKAEIEQILNPDVIFIREFDDALIGYCSNSGRPIYSVSKCIKLLMTDMAYQDAVEYFYSKYDTNQSSSSYKYPIFCDKGGKGLLLSAEDREE